jgi:hypothetical protein|tara:strand:+ start:68 stop:307 length:240 start_codon:yes stop_codon:yes gene_type:complete
MMALELFMDVCVDKFFDWCVKVLEIIGDYTGWGYELANIIIFVLLQPGLILLFFCLWIRAKIQNGRNNKRRSGKRRKYV